MKKKIILIVTIIFLISSAAGIYYIHKVLLPTIVKQQLITNLSSLTDAKVTLDTIHFNLLRGIVISGLRIYEKDDPSKILCSLKEASATFLVIPFIRENKIIILDYKLIKVNKNNTN